MNVATHFVKFLCMWEFGSYLFAFANRPDTVFMGAEIARGRGGTRGRGLLTTGTTTGPAPGLTVISGVTATPTVPTVPPLDDKAMAIVGLDFESLMALPVSLALAGRMPLSLTLRLGLAVAARGFSVTVSVQ